MPLTAWACSTVARHGRFWNSFTPPRRQVMKGVCVECGAALGTRQLQPGRNLSPLDRDQRQRPEPCDDAKHQEPGCRRGQELSEFGDGAAAPHSGADHRRARQADPKPDRRPRQRQIHQRAPGDPARGGGAATATGTSAAAPHSRRGAAGGTRRGDARLAILRTLPGGCDTRAGSSRFAKPAPAGPGGGGASAPSASVGPPTKGARKPGQPPEPGPMESSLQSPQIASLPQAQQNQPMPPAPHELSMPAASGTAKATAGAHLPAAPAPEPMPAAIGSAQFQPAPPPPTLCRR